MPEVSGKDAAALFQAATIERRVPQSDPPRACGAHALVAAYEGGPRYRRR